MYSQNNPFMGQNNQNMNQMFNASMSNNDIFMNNNNPMQNMMIQNNNNPFSNGNNQRDFSMTSNIITPILVPNHQHPLIYCYQVERKNKGITWICNKCGSQYDWNAPLFFVHTAISMYVVLALENIN